MYHALESLGGPIVGVYISICMTVHSHSRKFFLSRKIDWSNCAFCTVSRLDKMLSTR